MYNVKKIKLIIWDLDETLWHGTLSEGKVELEEEVKCFLNASLDRGIIHSICSKNEFENTKNKLEEFGIWDSFVFPSIEWTSKGNRVKEIISTMSLRDENVLFIDDNVSNLQEARFVCPNLMTATPDELKQLYNDILELPESDASHKRLSQYKVLECKQKEKSHYLSNEDFLMTCNIIADIKTDCTNHIDRIVDLVQRSNQLNYTKNRMNAEEIASLLEDRSVDSGYVSVKDRFGDYGIVGFYALREGKIIHFTFSCRTLGMRVEQWAYMQIGCPEIDIVQPVVSELNKTELPPWINVPEKVCIQSEAKLEMKGKVLLKGPCDLEQIFSFINKNDQIITEFTYVGAKGQSVEGYNHTSQLYSSLALDDVIKRELIQTYSWLDEKSLYTELSNDNTTCLILSMLPDGNLGVYRHKKTGAYIALCEKQYDITSAENWQLYIEKKVFTSGIDFNRGLLEQFSNDFVYCDNSDASLSIHFLDQIYSIVGSKLDKIILLLGSERRVNLPNQKKEMENRDAFHKIINGKIREWAKDKENIVLLSFDDYIVGDGDYVDSINHFVKRVYYDLAQDIITTIAYDGFSRKGKESIWIEEIKMKIKRSRVYGKLVYPIVCWVRARKMKTR